MHCQVAAAGIRSHKSQGFVGGRQSQAGTRPSCFYHIFVAAMLMIITKIGRVSIDSIGLMIAGLELGSAVW